MSGLSAFQKQQYLNIETFRKSGEGVKTPVWFVEKDGLLYAWTAANSGKVKRIRNNGRVRVAPSTASGAPLGNWQDAEAWVEATPQAEQHLAGWMRAKYGWLYRFLRWRAQRRGGQYVAVVIRLEPKP